MVNWPDFFNDPIFNPLISFLTVVILAWTAIEAFRGRRATAKSNELSLLPVLGIYFKGNSMRDRIIRIRNVGNGPAYSIKIDNYYLILDDIQKMWKMTLRVGGTNLLVPDEERDLEIKTWSNNKEVENKDFMIFALDPEGTDKIKRISIPIFFRNALGDNYYTVVEMGFGGVEVKKAPSRLGLSDHIRLKTASLLTTIQIKWIKFTWQFKEAGFGRREKFIPAFFRAIFNKVRNIL